MAVICSECGNSNEDDADFCASCGEPLEWTGVRAAAEEAAPAAAVVEAPAAPEPVYEAPAPEPVAPPPAAAAPEAPPAPGPPPPPAPSKLSRRGRRAQVPPPPPLAPPLVPPTPPPAATPEAPPAESAEPEPTPVAEAPVEEAPPAPPEPEAPAGPAPRPPEPRKPTVLPTQQEEDDEAARLAEEEQQRWREEQARKLVVPVARPAEPAPVVVAPVVAPPPVQLTWWQRFVRWFKRVILRQKPPVVAAAVAAPVVAATAAPAAPVATGPAPVGARAPAAQKPGEEVQRRGPRAVAEEAPIVEPGDLICTQCGTGNSTNNKFCKRCGSSLAEAVVAKKPPWWKRMFGIFSRKKRYEAGQRKKKQMQSEKSRPGIFWRLQGGGFKLVALAMIGVALLGAYKVFGHAYVGRIKDNVSLVKQRFLPSYKVVTPIHATASSHLRQKYSAGKAIDGIVNTAWISKPTKKDGRLQTITIHYAQPIHVGKIGIRNGDQTNPKAYPKQARLETARIFFYDKTGQQIAGKSKLCGFDDKPEFQTCGVDVKGVKSIKVRAIRVYLSQKGNSLAIAEIETRSLG